MTDAVMDVLRDWGTLQYPWWAYVAPLVVSLLVLWWEQRRGR